MSGVMLEGAAVPTPTPGQSCPSRALTPYWNTHCPDPRHSREAWCRQASPFFLSTLAMTAHRPSGNFSGIRYALTEQERGVTPARGARPL